MGFEGIERNASAGGSQFNQTIDLNLAALKYASTEFVRATIYHEIAHSDLRNKYNYELTDKEEHQKIRDEWFDKISSQLQSDFPHLSKETITKAKNLGFGENVLRN